MTGWLTNVAAMGVATDADAVAWRAIVAGLGGTVSDPDFALVSNFNKSLKANSLWVWDRLLLPCLGGPGNTAPGLVDIVTNTAATAINSPTFLLHGGVTSNGTSSYVKANCIISSQATNYTLNSGTLFGYFNTTRAAADSKAAFGTDNGTGVQTAMSLRLAAGTQDAYLNNTFASGHANGAVADTLGLSMVSRTASNLTTSTRRGVSVGTTAAAASAVPSVDMAFLAFNNNGVIINYETAQGAAFGIGAGLTVPQAVAFNTILETLLTGMGANA